MLVGPYNLRKRKKPENLDKRVRSKSEKKYGDKEVTASRPKKGPSPLPPTKEYAPIQRCVYHSERARSHQMILLEHSMCDCPATRRGRCSDSTRCSNSAAYMECPPECGEIRGGCNNRNVSDGKKCTSIEVRQTPLKGRGLFATARLRKGTFIGEYAGEIIDTEEKARRIQLAANCHHYMMSLSKGRYIDGAHKGNFIRFLNHSCDPNCMVRTYMVPVGRSGQKCKYDERVRVLTTKEIAKDEELSIAYNMQEYENGGDILPCYCGSAICSGKLGGREMEKKTSATKVKPAKRSSRNRKSGTECFNFP